jgi:hypothetical protein
MKGEKAHLKKDAQDFKKIKGEAKDIGKEVKRLVNRDKPAKKGK